MSNFTCQHCHTDILEGEYGHYVTGCEHYPAGLSPFRQGMHSDTICRTCIHAEDINYDCKQHRMVTAITSGYFVVKECAGYEAM